MIINKANIKQSGKVIQYFPEGFLPATTTLTNGNLNQTINEDFYNGYYVYTLGSFPTYEAARRYRDELRSVNKIYDAFVVAFRDGKHYNTLSEINK